MQDYMIRQGYLPLVTQNLEREDYICMIKDAQDGKPDDLVDRVITTWLEALQSLKVQEME